MSTRTRISKTARPIVRDKAFYLNQIEVEDSLFKKAVSIAERIFVAFVRENNIQVKVDADDLAEKVIARIEPLLQSEVRVINKSGPRTESDFSYDDDEPIVIKTEKIEISGDIGKTKKTSDTIDENMDALEGFSL